MDISLKKLLESLKAHEESVVIEAISALRRKGNIDSISPLIECYFASDSAQVKREIILLFNDLKDNRLSKIWVENLENFLNRPDFSAMVSCCWMASVDLGAELMSFATMFVKGDLMTAIESLTVIEQNMASAPDDTRNEMLDYLKLSAAELSPDKQKLLNHYLTELE